MTKKFDALSILADAMKSTNDTAAILVLADAWLELWREVYAEASR
jgi:hypothetical protein